MDTKSKIYIAGSRGLVGSALLRELRAREYHNLVYPTHAELDLTDPAQVKWWFSCHRPEYVFFCAAKVGGIADNVASPVEFLVQNLHMELNVLQAASDYACRKLIFVGTSCVYPRDCPQPIKEEYLLTGPLEKATEAYSIAKIAGIKLCQYIFEQYGDRFISALPCNVYGPRDSFNEKTSHCLPGIMARMHRAKVEGALTFPIWGRAETCREFIFADDLARALFTVMEKYDGVEPINTGSGLELSMEQLAGLIQRVVGYPGVLTYDATQPIGTPRKLLDSSKLRALGWAPGIPIVEGLERTYEWYLANAVVG